MKKRYDPSLVNKHIKCVPIKQHDFRHLGELGYYTAVMMMRPRRVVALHEVPQKTIERFRDVSGIEFHDLKVKANGVAPAQLKRYAKASEILEDAIKDGETAVLSCELGMGRTGNAMYLLHRRMGASHDEAKELVDVRKQYAEALREEFEAGFPSLKKRNGKNGK